MDKVLTVSLKKWEGAKVEGHKAGGRVYPISYKYPGLAFARANELRSSGVICWVIGRWIVGPWYVHIQNGENENEDK